MLWPEIVNAVVKPLVQPSLSQTTQNIKGKDFHKEIQYPIKEQIKWQPVVPNSVENPGSSTSAQVKLEEDDGSSA